MQVKESFPYEASSVRKRLTALLDWSGLPQTELARRLNKSNNWVSRRTLGVGAIRADEVELFAKALRVTACALVDDQILDATVHSADEQPTTLVVVGEDRQGRPVPVAVPLVVSEKGRMTPHEAGGMTHAAGLLDVKSRKSAADWLPIGI